jgi:hypothetical protein
MAELELNEICGAVDLGARDVWDELDAEQLKHLTAFLFTLPRFISNPVTSSREIQEHFVLTVNEFYNKHWFVLSKSHPQLLWQLITLCSHESKRVFNRKWLRISKAKASGKVPAFLAKIYPNAKLDDIEVMARLMTKADAQELAELHGYTPAQIKQLF